MIKEHSSEELMMLHVALGRSVQFQDIPTHNLFSWGDAIFSALLLTLAFDTGGAHRSQWWLKRLGVRTWEYEHLSLDIRLFCARKDAALLKATVNLLLGPRLCFASAFAICAGLRRLGFACHVVVGYEQIHQYCETPMDAYVCYEQEPINTLPEVKYGFVPLLTYGLEAER